jgi:YHS domain-containing protein
MQKGGGQGSVASGRFGGRFDRYKVHGGWKKILGRMSRRNLARRKINGVSDLRTRENGSVVAGRAGIGRKILYGGIRMTDPVCGLRVDERSEFHTQFAGKKYFFCSEDCRKEFEAEPDEYIETAAA